MLVHYSFCNIICQIITGDKLCSVGSGNDLHEMFLYRASHIPRILAACY